MSGSTETSPKTHLSVVISGHVDSGKSTTTGRLIYELGGIPQREMEKLKKTADELGKGSFCFAFYMDTQKEERARGITIQCTTKEFFTDNYHYTIIDAPGHRDFIKNMVSGSSQADVGVLMVPADGNFTTSIAKGNHKEGEVPGQTRQHARLLNLLGVKQLIVCVNKMDSDTAKYSQDRFDEVKNEMKDMLIRVGWNKKFVEESVPVLPISGWQGDNLVNQSTNMSWWSGVDVKAVDGSTVKVTTLVEALNNFVKVPPRNTTGVLRVPISGVYSIKGVGDVLTGRVEQGVVKPNDKVVFMPSHTDSNPCEGKVFTVEMHHKKVEQAVPGDNVGFNIKGLDKNNMPRVGDIMILKQDATLKPAKSFTAQVQVLEFPNEIKVGYTPVGMVRTAKCAIRLSEIKWRISKETGNAKQENPPYLKSNDVAECVFEPQQSFAVDTYTQCENLGRLCILEGNTVQMIGKIVKVDY